MLYLGQAGAMLGALGPQLLIKRVLSSRGPQPALKLALRSKRIVLPVSFVISPLPVSFVIISPLSCVVCPFSPATAPPCHVLSALISSTMFTSSFSESAFGLAFTHTN